MIDLEAKALETWTACDFKCHNCGKKTGPLVKHNGKLWCPGACVIRARGKR